MTNNDENKSQGSGKELNIKVEELQAVEGIDLSKFDGVKTKIKSVKAVDYGEQSYKGVTSRNVKLVVETELLPNSNDVEICAREYITLFEKDGKMSYSTGATSNAQKMLTFFKVNNFKELVGREVTAIKKVSGTGKERIGFAFGN